MMPIKDPEETVTVEFDFTGEMDSIQSAVVTATVQNGTDANPSAILSGTHEIDGSKIYQKITGGVSGVIYRLRCKALNASDTIVRVGLLPVKTINQ